MNQHRIVRGYNDGVELRQKDVLVHGTGEVRVKATVDANTVETFSFPIAGKRLVSLYLETTVDMDVKIGGTDLRLLADDPFQWNDNGYIGNLFDEDTKEIQVSLPPGRAAEFRAFALVDASRERREMAPQAAQNRPLPARPQTTRIQTEQSLPAQTEPPAKPGTARP